MDRRWMMIIGFSLALVLLAPSIIADWTIVQAQNTTLPQDTNDTRRVFNMIDNTVTLINATTNETISVMKFTTSAGNTTANETLPTSAGNTTANETLPTSAGNTTANETLTTKFKELQGK
jgi:hypothetical protein